MNDSAYVFATDEDFAATDDVFVALFGTAEVTETEFTLISEIRNDQNANIMDLQILVYY